MSRWNDPLHEMRGARIDEGTLDRLLQGRILPDDAPPGYSAVASILVAAASRPTDVELRLQGPHVAAAREAIGRRNRRRRPGALGLATGLLVLLLLVVPGLAAAKLLPEPAQNAVTTVLKKVGITLPDADQPIAPASPSRGEPGGTGVANSSDLGTHHPTTPSAGAKRSSVEPGASQGGQQDQGEQGGQGGQQIEADQQN